MPTKTKAKKTLTTKQRATRHLKHAVVPHKGNGFHPHLIRRGGLSIVLAVFVVLQFVSSLHFGEPNSGFVLGTQASFSNEELLNESNKVRQDNKAAVLTLSDKLNSAASMKAGDMLNRQYWAHDAPDGTTPWHWFREVNYRYDFAGENLAKGFETPAAVVAAWMSSPEHRQNALSPDYQDVGFGVAEGTLDGEQTKVVVALYASPVGAPIQGQGQVLAAQNGGLSPIARLGAGLQSLDVAKLGSLALLGFTTIVALVAHTYRKQLPVNIRKTWKRHHGLYKGASLLSLIFGLILLYGGGQIL
jgi:hypothetical protein